MEVSPDVIASLGIQLADDLDKAMVRVCRFAGDPEVSYKIIAHGAAAVHAAHAASFTLAHPEIRDAEQIVEALWGQVRPHILASVQKFLADTEGTQQ